MVNMQKVPRLQHPLVDLFLLQVGECGGEDEVEDPPEGRCEGDALGQCPARHQFQGAADRE